MIFGSSPHTDGKMSLNVTENVNNLAEDLEKQELDAPGGIPTPPVYARLLAVYLYQNDLCNARFLWKRIPQNIKDQAELNQIWEVGQKMWLRDFPGTYAALHAAGWSENVAYIMEALLESVRKRAINLVARAYSSISLDDFSMFVGLEPDQAIQGAADQGWRVDAAARMIYPHRPTTDNYQIASSEDQLHKLTEFVSFLEN